MSIKVTGTLAAILAAAAAGHAAARSPVKSGARDCFYARNIEGWAPVGRDAVNIRVFRRDYYQLTLLGSCPNLDWTETLGLSSHGSSWICSGLDATIIAPGPVGIHRCEVKSIRRLTAEEVRSLPPRQRP